MGFAVVCVVVDGNVVIEYPVAPYAGVHARSTVVICWFPSERLVTAFGMTNDPDVVMSPAPSALIDVTFTVSGRESHLDERYSTGVCVVVAGVVLIEYELALALPGHVTVTLVRPAMVTLVIDEMAAAGVTYDTELNVPPIPVGTTD